MKLHVVDSSGEEILSQAVDTDYDDYHKPDIPIFQADFAPNETKSFTVTAGKKGEYTKDDFRAYGRFVRERFDDFAWENDRVGHRTYGKALRTWKGEPLTSSAIDIWAKRTPKLVIRQLSRRSGEGVDAYSLVQRVAVVAAASGQTSSFSFRLILSTHVCSRTVQSV